MHKHMVVVNVRSTCRAVTTRAQAYSSPVHSPSSFSFSTATAATLNNRPTYQWGEPQQGTAKDLPLTGLFAVNKPAGITSTTIIDLVQWICQGNKSHPLVKGVLALDDSKRAKRGLVKIGHGGTLDPLARGIVVIGMGAGCKKLHNMSVSTKVYIAEARLGMSTDTLDSVGSLVARGPTDHVTREKLVQTLKKFKGEIDQVPPLYSALSMDGKRLYDYAREGKPLPREIPSRKIQIFDLELLSYLPHKSSSTTPSSSSSPALEDLRLTSEYGFKTRSLYSSSLPSLPPPSLSPSMSSLGLKSGFKVKKQSDPPSNLPQEDESTIHFHIRVHCSSGTYIRTLIADIAAELGTVGHMTDLLRLEQSGFKLGDGEKATLEFSDCEDIEKIDYAIQSGNRIWDENQTRENAESFTESLNEMIARGS